MASPLKMMRGIRINVGYVVYIPRMSRIFLDIKIKS